MREIKFRLYDKIGKKYFYNGVLDNGDMVVINLDGSLCFSDDDSYKQSDFILEQYTGIKDLDGVNVYEGDIVLTSECGWKGTVVWGNAGFLLQDKDGGFCSDTDAWDYVVGNIHEGGK